MGYERPNISALEPYVPGEQPAGEQAIKLNTNENPYPPGEAVMQAIREVSAEQLRRYPSPAATRFRETAARAHQLSPQQVIATNGGDELIRLAITVFCEPRGAGPGPGGIGIAEPSYSLYPILGRIHDTPVTSVPLEEPFALPEDLADRLNEARCNLALIVNPHAPSGRLEPLGRLEQIAREFDGVLLVDEAYVDFAERDAAPLLDPQRGLENVILLRSMSKGYSLAGIRFGYGLAPGRLIEALDKARDSYNTDVLSQAAATAALEHRQQQAEIWQRVIEERLRLATALGRLGWSVLPSQTNFLLAAPSEGAPDARAIFQQLRQRRIYVRYFDQPRIDEKLRITVGKPAENDALIEAITDIMQPQATRG